MNVGTILKRKRELLNLSQQEVADYVGISKSLVSRWENNEVKNMGLDKIRKICSVLSLDPMILINADLEKVPSILGSYDYPYIPDAVAAGIPENIDGLSELPKITIADELLGSYARNKNIIIMRVNGESMNKVISDGSIIAVKTDIELSNLKNGDLVVFNHEYEYSVKRFFRIENKLVFRPDSTDLSFTDIIYTIEDDVEIVGKVIMSNVNYD